MWCALKSKRLWYSSKERFQVLHLHYWDFCVVDIFGVEFRVDPFGKEWPCLILFENAHRLGLVVRLDNDAHKQINHDEGDDDSKTVEINIEINFVGAAVDIVAGLATILRALHIWNNAEWTVFLVVR